MRKEILKLAHEWEEKIHILGGVMAVCFVVTFFSDRWTQHGTEAETPFMEILHWTLIGIDVLIVVVFIGILLFRFFGIAKPTRVLTRAIGTSQLNRKVREWFAGELGDPVQKVVRFCTEADIEDLVELNHSAFKDSIFEVEEEKLMRRNTSWIRRNARIFMLILDPMHQDNYIGYSAMATLTKEGLDSYLDGAIKDADIPAVFIASTKATTAGVLIFAIYLKKEFSFQKTQASRNYSIYFLACVRHHLEALFPKPKGKAKPLPYPPIYVQTEYPAMRRRLTNRGFVETGKVSADGFDLLVFEHPFEHPDKGGQSAVLEQEPKKVSAH